MALSKREAAKRRRRSQHNYHLKKTYGITIEQYELILEAQGGKCAICRGGTSKKHFAVDHNHKTGEVRGLLCARCNSGLAKFMDKHENVVAAATYLLVGARRVRTLLADASGEKG